MLLSYLKPSELAVSAASLLQNTLEREARDGWLEPVVVQMFLPILLICAPLGQGWQQAARGQKTARNSFFYWDPQSFW